MKLTIPTVSPWRLVAGRLAAMRHSLFAISVALVSAAYLAASGLSEPTVVAWFVNWA